MGCRSFLSPWKDENGNYKFYGRFNKGVVTINLVDVALTAKKEYDNQNIDSTSQALYHDGLFDIFYSIGMIGFVIWILYMIKGMKNSKLNGIYKFTFILLIIIL